MTRRISGILGISLFLAAATLSAQSISTPKESPRATVSQEIGPVIATIDYGSPHVHAPGTGAERKIWGELVPFGLANLGFGTCTECPWRAGANENTTIDVTDDVLIDGQPLPAGKYAIFMIPDQTEWTVVFSKNSTSWGSFFYDPNEDALRVKVKPAKNAYRESLTYDFVDRKADRATVAMQWEELSIPFTISVEKPEQKYLAKIRNELRNSPGFYWQNWVAATRYALDHKLALDEALVWAKKASDPSDGFGNENFRTLSLLADAQEANGLAAEAKTTREKAINHPTAVATDLHMYARGLLAAGKKDEALAVWKLNAKRFGDAWPVNVGLARGYSAIGDYKTALKFAKLAAAQAPDDLNRKNLQKAIEVLSAGKDMNQM